MVNTINERNNPKGSTTDIARNALQPKNATKPGLMINVAALVIPAAKESPSTIGEKPFPKAKSCRFFVFYTI